MNTNIKSLLAAGSLLALSAVTSHAQLLIGSVSSYFSNPLPVGPGYITSYTSVLTAGGTNFWTGQNTDPQFGGPTGTQFGPNSFISPISDLALANAGSNTRSLGLFNWTNQLTVVGTSQLSADFNFEFTLNGDLIQRTTKIVFDGPVLEGANDQFTVDLSTLFGGSFSYNGLTYTYGFNIVTDIGAPASDVTLPEGVSGNTRLIVTVFSPVPEPSTYALFGVVALMGLVAVRRFRSSKSVA